MSDNQNDVLSRLMDGEMADLKPSQCLADVCQSDEQKQKWARYHLARDAMRGESVHQTFSIASAVSAALEDEPTYSNVTSLGQHTEADAQSAQPASVQSHAGQTTTNKARSRWGLGAAGLGVAASAALATVIGLDYFQNTGSAVAPNVVVAGSPNLTSPSGTGAIMGASAGVNSVSASVTGLGGIGNQQAPVDLVSNRGSFWLSGQSGQRVGAEMRLNQLLGDHIEHSPNADWRGMLPYSRLVGYDASVGAEQ